LSIKGLPPPDKAAVFLNVPFDSAYQPLFIALIATLSSLGRKPRSVLEIPEHGQGRLARIIGRLESCQVSIHDLSRVGQPVRFNMPFELGLAYAIRKYSVVTPPYVLVLLEKVPHRLGRTLSDMAGHDPGIHGGKPLGVISCVLDSLGTGLSDPAPETVYGMWRALMQAARRLMQAEGRNDVFSRTLFKRLTAASTELAVRAGLIAM